MPELPDHRPLVERFQEDLGRLELRDFIQKHISDGIPSQIGVEDYFELRRIVAKHFQLHPSAVIVVGSCRQGFSIAPKKRYAPFRSDSDLDIAVVSSSQFDNYWDAVFEYGRSDLAWGRSRKFSKFVKSLFNGWIEPRGLPSAPVFRLALEWTRFFDGLMGSRRFGPRRISARLYRNWERLEAYQERAVQQCLRHLKDQDNA